VQIEVEGCGPNDLDCALSASHQSHHIDHRYRKALPGLSPKIEQKNPLFKKRGGPSSIDSCNRSAGRHHAAIPPLPSERVKKG
jgi:hypothetical protein